jgi:HEAT repeat protein
MIGAGPRTGVGGASGSVPSPGGAPAPWTKSERPASMGAGRSSVRRHIIGHMEDADDLSDSDLMDRAVAVMQSDPEHDQDDSWAFVRALQRRASESVFQQARTWCGADDAGLRRLGANVLGQLGAAAEHPFAAVSTPVLEGLLGDPDESVVSCALTALGHLGTGETMTICALASSPSDRIRYNVAWCLGLREDPEALATLIALSRDPDAEVRDWATFGVGSLSDADSPEIRQALVDRLDDDDAETRAEATLGLVKRGDGRGDAAVAAALSRPDVRPQVQEAADLIAQRAQAAD